MQLRLSERRGAAQHGVRDADLVAREPRRDDRRCGGVACEARCDRSACLEIDAVEQPAGELGESRLTGRQMGGFLDVKVREHAEQHGADVAGVAPRELDQALNAVMERRHGRQRT